MRSGMIGSSLAAVLFFLFGCGGPGISVELKNALTPVPSSEPLLETPPETPANYKETKEHIVGSKTQLFKACEAVLNEAGFTLTSRDEKTGELTTEMRRQLVDTDYCIYGDMEGTATHSLNETREIGLTINISVEDEIVTIRSYLESGQVENGSWKKNDTLCVSNGRWEKELLQKIVQQLQ